MIQGKRITFLCNDRERNQIYELPMILERSQGDAVRWAVRQAHQELANKINKSQNPTG